ncbi:NACHT domain-containing protein [Streptomyces sp. NPDC050085]|uniref:NACHT domain-containing protein n=1 Tax=Streptomyces sp. NPDC050085 TaxID=3365600 RepID=UPI003798687C
MDPAVLGTRLASSVLVPALRRLFVQEGPGAGLTDRAVRLSSLVSFRGEKRTLTDRDVERLARKLVGAALEGPGEPPFPYDESEAVVLALARTLHSLGDLDMDDVQAVRLGHRELARTLRRAAPALGLSTDADLFLATLTEWACLHILHFFTQRSPFVARTLVEQSRDLAQLLARTDELIRRLPPAGARDGAFEERYLRYVAQRHRHLTIYGIDLRDAPDRWPLEVAYLSLEATAAAPQHSFGGLGDTFDDDGRGTMPERLRAEDAFEQGHDRVLLRGEAGSGKTTLVQWLAVTAAAARDRIPFVLPLRTLIRAGQLPAPAAFLSAVGCPLTAPDGWAERVLDAGRALVLVDGLDEIATVDRHRARDWLTGLIAAHPGNRWLLTSRPTAVRPGYLADQGFRELLLPPMRAADVTTFVERWHTAADAAAYAPPLLDALRTKRDLARLATNPLMCGLICALHRERHSYLPTDRVELYDAALSMLLTRRDRERGTAGPELGEAVQLELLQHLAYALILSGRSEMSRDNATALLERRLPAVAAAAALGDATTVLATLLLRSGLLRQPAEGVVDFVHRTFQDYLGARYAVDEGHALPFVQNLADDPSGEDAIRLAVAHARPAERDAMLRELLSHDRPRLTLLALACLEHATTLAPSVRTHVEDRAARLIPPRTADDAKALAEAGPLVLELLPGPDGLTDEEAHGVAITASILGATEPAGALGVLRRLRAHPSLDVRRQLAGTWPRFNPVEYAAEVLDHLGRTDLVLRIETTEQYAALRRMRPWHELTLHGPHRLADFAAALPDRAAVTLLDLRDNAELRDLGALTAFPALGGLWMSDCPNATGLGRLAELPLTDLAFSRTADLTGLTGLRKLKRLSLDQELPGDSLADGLPVEAPLEFLFLGRGTTDRTGLRGLHHWPTLTTLSLGRLTTAPTASDWEYVAELPALTHLYLNGVLLHDHPASLTTLPALPRIEVLRLASLHGTEDLSALPARFPYVRHVVLQTAPGRTFPADRYAPLFPDAEITIDQR